MAKQEISLGVPAEVAAYPQVSRHLIALGTGAAARRLFVFPLPLGTPVDLDIPLYEDCPACDNIQVESGQKKEAEQAKKKGPVVLKRLSVSSNGHLAVVSEGQHFGREIILDLVHRKPIHKLNSAITLFLSNNKTSASFVQEDCLKVKVTSFTQSDEKQQYIPAYLTEICLGEKLLLYPLTLNIKERDVVVFLQESQGKPEVVGLYLDHAPELVVCKSSLAELGLPIGHKVTDLNLSEAGDSVWLLCDDLTHSNTSEAQSALLWQPTFDNTDPSATLSGRLLGTINAISDVYPLFPTAVEEDYDRLNFKVSKGYSIHIHEWREVFESINDEMLVTSWVNRQKIDSKVGTMANIEIKQGHISIGKSLVLSTEKRTVYIVSLADSRIEYKLEFTTATVEHVVVDWSLAKVIFIFDDGQVNEYVVAPEKLILLNGKQPQAEAKNPRDEAGRHCYMLAPDDLDRAPRARAPRARAAMCSII